MDAEKLFLENLRRLPIDKIIGIVEVYIAMNRTLRKDSADLWNENKKLKEEVAYCDSIKSYKDILYEIRGLIENSGV